MAISSVRILALRHLKLNLPLQDARARGSGLSFRDVAGALQRDGQRGVSERITGSESRKSQGRGDRLFEAPGVAQSPDEAMMGLEVIGVGCDGRTEGLRSLKWQPRGQQIKAGLGKLFGGLCVGFCHGCYQDIGRTEEWA